MKRSYRVATTTAATQSAALLLAPAPGLGQLPPVPRQLTVFDGDGNVVSTIGEPDTYMRPSFSPDRTRVAVILAKENEDLWVFDLATGNGTQITSSQPEERVLAPVWSPDGSQVAYVVWRDSCFGLYREASSGEGEAELLYQHSGWPITLTDWSLDGRFLSFYSADLFGGTLYLLPLDGDGQAFEAARSESAIVEARLSPDSRFLAYRSDETGRNEIFVRAVALPGDAANASVEQWQVSTDGGLGMVSWRRDGQELYYFGADRGVMAVDVDTARGFEFSRPRLLFTAPDAIPVTGIPHALLTITPDTYGNVSRDGQRVVFAVPPARVRQITVFDREGNVVSRVGEPGLYSRPVFSPDGSRVAVLKEDLETGNVDVWTFNVSTGEGMPVTSDNFPKVSPVWSPDGTHVAYVSTKGNYDGIYRKACNGEGREELLFRYTPGAYIGLDDFSADGRFLIVDGGDIVLVVPLTGTDPLAREAIEFVREEFEAISGRFSPDGRFLAYTSDETGRNEVYVRPFDVSGTVPVEGQWQVTQDGGGRSIWRQDGKEMFYLTRDRETRDVDVMAVDVTTTPEFQIGTPRLLFRLTGSGPGTRPGNQYVGPNGQRFVFVRPAGGP